MASIAAETWTTCGLVSIPAEIWTVTYSSGQSLQFFPATTFTEAVTSTRTVDGSLQAQCFTGTAGQASTPTFYSAPGATVTCSTSVAAPVTFVTTRTSGELNTRLSTTYTQSTAETVTIQALPLARCDIVPDYENDATCNTVAPLTWASLVITFITIQLTWWIFDLPVLWQKQAEGGRLRLFLDIISWACVRSHGPGSAALIAAWRGEDASDFARMYYLGMKRQATPAEWTRWKLCTSIFSDLLTVVGTGLTVYQACTLTQYDARVHMGVGLWVYPSLPVALIGLCLLAGERWFPRTYPSNCLLLALTVAVLAGAGGSIAYLLSKYDAASNHLWVLSLICYILMIMPLIALRWLIIPASAIIWFARVGGVSVAALGHYSGGHPYCHFQGIGFAVVYMVMGGIAAVLGSFGAFYHLNRAMKAHKQ